MENILFAARTLPSFPRALNSLTVLWEHAKSVPFGWEEKWQKGLRNNKLRWKPRVTRGDDTKSSHYAAERCLLLTPALCILPNGARLSLSLLHALKTQRAWRVIDDLAQLREADNTECVRGHGRQPFSITKNALCAFDGKRARASCRTPAFWICWLCESCAISGDN